MARLRVFNKNGGNVYELMLKKKREMKREEIIGKESKEIIKARKKVSNGETIGNIEVLNIGKCTGLHTALKSLR